MAIPSAADQVEMTLRICPSPREGNLWERSFDFGAVGSVDVHASAFVSAEGVAVFLESVVVPARRCPVSGVRSSTCLPADRVVDLAA